jgi:excisionase family DNA binding protein
MISTTERAKTILLKVEDAAAELQISRTRMYDLIARGEVASVKIGGSRRVPYAELVAYTERLTAAQSVSVDSLMV